MDRTIWRCCRRASLASRNQRTKTRYKDWCISRGILALRTDIYGSATTLSLVGFEDNEPYIFIFAILLKEAEPAPASDYVSTAKGMIEYNLDQPLSVRMLSDSLNLDPSYFTRIFTKAEGISPKKFILNKKMESAKQLLKNTDASVLEISNSMGFFDQLYFSRIFRKTVGMSPTEYRKTIRDKNK